MELIGSAITLLFLFILFIIFIPLVILIFLYYIIVKPNKGILKSFEMTLKNLREDKPKKKVTKVKKNTTQEVIDAEFREVK